MQTIEISGTTGVGPFNVYLCDITLSYCLLISGSTSIPPTVTFNLPFIFQNSEQVIVKLVDSLGCESFELFTCNTSTTTTTTTPILTPLPSCGCIEFMNTGMTESYFSYTDCQSNILIDVPIPAGIVMYVCGNNPIGSTNVIYTVTEPCVNNSCPEPLPCI